MRLYLVRHGEAQPRDVDPKRPLNRRGKYEAQSIARLLAPMNISVHAVWHSGEPRARQTAEIIAPVLSSWKGVTHKRGLGPNSPPEPAKKVIESVDDDLMIVGHLPFLGRLAALMLTNNDGANSNHRQQRAKAPALYRLLESVTGRVHRSCRKLIADDKPTPPPEVLAFRHGAIACLEQRQGAKWKLAWMLVPGGPEIWSGEADSQAALDAPSTRPSSEVMNEQEKAAQKSANAQPQSKPTSRQADRAELERRIRARQEAASNVNNEESGEDIVWIQQDR